jgi:PadR family transcriptional regulator PadR
MWNGTKADELFENLRLELRRGSLILAVLAELRAEQYGYTLRKALAEHGMAIDESTLYPLLRRLETQGLLLSQWREEDKRNKRFYRLSPDGELILARLLEEWRAINLSLDRIAGGSTPQGEDAPSESDRSGESGEPAEIDAVPKSM